MRLPIFGGPENANAFSGSGVLPMLMRSFFASAALIFGQIKVWTAAAKAHLDTLEARVNAHGIIFSDVFGADTFVSRNATSDHPTRSPSLGGGGPVRWDDGLEFEQAQRGEPNDSKRLFTASIANVAARFDSDGDNDLSDVPAFLTRPRPEPSRDHSIEAIRRFSMRRHLPTLLCAGILLIVWITAGRSGPFSQPSHSAADAIAERFVGAGEGSAMAGDDIPNADARLEFAPRFAVLYADLVSKDGVCGDDGALDTIQGAASIIVRNLPSGTVLSAGEQMSATAWRLKPDDLKAIVMKIPADHSVPIQAKIETHDASGSVLGQMAVEIRETATEPSLGAAYQRKTNRPAASKTSNSKRRPSDGGAQQLAKKSGATGDAATAQPANPAQQQLLTQLPFFPGAYDKNSPPGTTVGQQILINLGVIPAPPTSTALTQNN